MSATLNGSVSNDSMLLSCIVAGVLVAANAGVVGPDGPNFSGEWVRVEPPEDPLPVLTIVQDEQTIKIEVRSSGGQALDYGVGTVGGVIGPIPGERSQVEWSWKDGIVITWEDGRMIPGAVRQEVWSLDRQGRLVVAITMRRPNAAPTTTRFVRQEALNGLSNSLFA